MRLTHALTEMRRGTKKKQVYCVVSLCQIHPHVWLAIIRYCSWLSKTEQFRIDFFFGHLALVQSGICGWMRAHRNWNRGGGNEQYEWPRNSKSNRLMAAGSERYHEMKLPSGWSNSIWGFSIPSRFMLLPHENTTKLQWRGSGWLVFCQDQIQVSTEKQRKLLECVFLK